MWLAAHAHLRISRSRQHSHHHRRCKDALHGRRPDCCGCWSQEPGDRYHGARHSVSVFSARTRNRHGAIDDARNLPMNRQKPEDVIGAARPFTGKEYLESLRDGREVYIYGERVKDVTTHPAFRNAARTIARLYDALHDPEAEGRADLPDRHRLGHVHPQVLPRRALARGPDRPARRDRALGAAVLRLDGPLAGLQGLADERARRQRRVLREVRRQRQALVRALAEPRAVHEPRHRQSAGRPHEGGRPGQGRVHHHPEGDRRRHRRVGRQGGGDLGGDHALQFHGPERARCRSTTPISR